MTPGESVSYAHRAHSGVEHSFHAPELLRSKMSKRCNLRYFVSSTTKERDSSDTRHCAAPRYSRCQTVHRSTDRTRLATLKERERIKERADNTPRCTPGAGIATAASVSSASRSVLRICNADASYRRASPTISSRTAATRGCSGMRRTIKACANPAMTARPNARPTRAPRIQPPGRAGEK